ncbi:hypothetical protein WA026_017517 [Henosepilachna vigintioctopunctata]|uniref:Prostaglandin reductase 1 n=1 Tax=Henosepilachna vigintioctopunctata TaxID=420089 RepID=A0AAW1UZI1_9CUCU
MSINNVQRIVSHIRSGQFRILNDVLRSHTCVYNSKAYLSSAGTVTGQKFILQNKFKGFPKESDVKLLEEELPALQDGQFLCESVYISVDPYQRAYYQRVGDVVLGSQVARIIDSKNPRYPVGKHVIGNYGWKTHHILDDSPSRLGFSTVIIPESVNQPLSYFLGILGMPGVTANFGLLEICQPKHGETVVVTGAAGAVGSLVGQIAKIKGCRVIGVVGSNEKGDWITKDLGFDGFINYKEDNFSKLLTKQAPNGVDCYFDNVGGEISTQIMRQMNLYGRISVCGAIAVYNSTKDEAKASIVQTPMVFKQLKMEGFLVNRWLNRWNEAVNENAQWLKEGKLKSRETITKGFENTFQAFTDMLKGVNFGKAIVEL